MRYATSSKTPPTPPGPTPTTYPLSAATAPSAARSPTRRAFPPKTLAAALAETTHEITDRPNPPRRHRTYPRVVKRYRAHHHCLKRTTDHGQLHNGHPRSTSTRSPAKLNGIGRYA